MKDYSYKMCPAAAPEAIWRLITSLTDTAWRSNVIRTIVTGDRHYVEHTTDGYITAYTVTDVVPYARLELDFENCNIKGHRVFCLSKSNNRTVLLYTERVETRKSHYGPYLGTICTQIQQRMVWDILCACDPTMTLKY